MKLKLIRKYFKDTYTIGKLYIDNIYFCDTIEDKDRKLDNSMSLEEIKELKIKGITAIPTGVYNISLDIKSPKYSNFTKYPYAKICDGKMPRLLNIKGYDGVLIHAGNTAKDTEGCLLVGVNKAVGKVLDSQNTFKKLYLKLKEAKNKREKITIEIVRN